MTTEVRITDPQTGGMKGQKQEQWSLVDPTYRRAWVHSRPGLVPTTHTALGCELLDACLRFERGNDEALLTVLTAAENLTDARTLANVYGMGSRKYDRGNWRKGYAWSLSIDALWRHTVAWLVDGEENDPESGLPHKAHACWHAHCLNDFYRLRLGTDDRLWKQADG
jgi:hypothetical protein